MSESVIGGVIWPNCKQMGKKKRQKAEKVVVKPITTVDLIGEDLLQIVLSKLPAKSFASAACVNRSWNAVSRRVLDRPKLSSFVSLNPSLQAAVEEVVNKVLNEPTRPHFAILCISPSFKLRDAHRYTREKLGKRIPVVSYKSNGLIGREALTNEFKEIQWDMDPDSLSHVVFYGVSLTVGFLPGLKVDALPLSLSADFQRPAIEKFVMEIRNHTNSVSGCTSPAGIIMFGAEGFHMKHLLDEMDYAMHPDTVIVGDECCKFLYSPVGDSEYCSYRRSPYAGVALLFMKDKDKPRGIGDIQFHVAISAGITPTGPTFKAAAVKEMTEETWLSATTAERRQHINGQTMLHNIDEECAVEEVVDKVLSEPIRPQFAILCVSSFFSLPLAHSYITERLGSSIPVVTLTSRGIIGENAQSSRFGEMSYTLFDDESYRLSLTVGFVPGLKVDALPLLWSKDVLPQLCIDKFAIDISELADSISGCTSPTGIIMFGGEEVNMKPVLDKMDIAMHPETFIVGDASCGFYYRAVGDTGKFTHQKETCAGVALLFMKDPNKHCGIGDIQFHVAISPGMAPIGPTYKAASVKERYEEHSTWLSATNGENYEHIDGNTMLLDIEEQLGDYTPESDELFIGVSRTRNFFLNFEEPRWSTSMSFHEVVESDETYLCVRDCGIKTGDKFRFYYGNRFRNPLSSPCSMSKDMEKLKHDLDASADKRQVFGSFIFSCVDDDLLFTKSNVNSSPFLENFPGVSLGGTFCSEAIKRDCSSMYGQEQTRCCLHPHSIVYLVMSYMPPQLGDHI